MADMWDGVAGAWERNAAFVDAHLRAATEAMLDAAGVREGAAVLDLATGPGGAGLAAADRVGARGRVVLADAAPEMVAAAARRAGGRAGVETLVCDQGAIDAPDGTFDAVLCRHGLMFAADPEAAVREAARVLRPGGGYAAATWDRREANPWIGLILDAVGAQFGAPVPPPGMPGPFSLDDAAALGAILERAGLEDVQVRAVPTPMTHPSVEAWWEQTPQLAGPLALALAGLEPEVREAIRARALEAGAAAARPAPGGEGVVLGGSALVASGRVPG